MFNTGTVVGVFTNLYGAGYFRNFVPSFSWGGPQGYKTYQLEKTFETAKKVMARRGKEMTKEDQDILSTIFELSAQYRTWDKVPV